MAEPSAQDIQEQVRQAQESAWAQAAAQPQQAPANTPAPQFSPPPPPIPPQPQSLPGAAQTRGVTISMGKVSLLAACLSLMLLGAFTFLGGFFFGMWFSGPNTTSQTVATVAELQSLGMIPAQQQAQPAPPQGGGVVGTLKQSAQAIDFGRIATGQAGNIASSAVTGVTVPKVPSFLSPLVSATQLAVGQQVGYKAQQQVGQQMNQTIGSPPPSQPPQQQMAQPSAPAQAGAPQQPSPPSSSSASPLSQGIMGGGNDGYTVQLGVFAAHDNAQALVNHLQALNYPSQVVEGKSPDGSVLYYVQSGQYNDYKTAAEAATQFAAQNIPGALIVKISQSSKGGS